MKYNNHRPNATIVGVLVVAIAVAQSCADGCPRIVSRSEWGAEPAGGPVSKLSTYPAPFVVAHHTAGVVCVDRESCSQQARSIQRQHIHTNKWSDIGYNFLIGGDGSVYEGRGWGQSGAHAPSVNSKSHGIVFVGNFVASIPTDAAISAFHALVRCGVDLKHIDVDYKLVGHRQVRRTECPGEKLFAMVKQWPHFTLNPLDTLGAAPNKTSAITSKESTAGSSSSSLWNYRTGFALFACVLIVLAF